MRGSIRPAWMAGILLALGAGILFLGCEDIENVDPANLPPETFLAQIGRLDTVNSHVILNWWGQDPDGEIMGFEFRWEYNFDQRDSSATAWSFTPAYEDTFALPATISPMGDTTFGRHRFHVRAVDERSLRDPTPVVQVYDVNNSPPVLTFRGSGAYPSTSFPAFTVFWNVEDPDGNETVSHFLAWLDGASDTLVVPGPDSTVTFTPGNFENRYGPRRLSVVAFDDANTTSDTIQYSWTVIEPIGDVLLIDDTPAGALSTVSDPYFRSNLDSVVGAGTYSILDTDVSPFRTEAEASAVLSLFDKVVWYQGAAVSWNTTNVNRSLGNAQPGIEELLGRGGSILIESMNLFGTDGALDDAFAQTNLGIESFFIYPSTDPMGRSGTTNHPIEIRTVPDTSGVRHFWQIDGDSLQGLHDHRPRGIFGGVECFSLATGSDTLFTIPENVTFWGQPDGYHIGVKGTTSQGGRLVYLSFPLSRCDFLYAPGGDTDIFNDDDLRLLLRQELGF